MVQLNPAQVKLRQLSGYTDGTHMPLGDKNSFFKAHPVKLSSKQRLREAPSDVGRKQTNFLQKAFARLKTIVRGTSEQRRDRKLDGAAKELVNQMARYHDGKSVAWDKASAAVTRMMDAIDRGGDGAAAILKRMDGAPAEVVEKFSAFAKAFEENYAREIKNDHAFRHAYGNVFEGQRPIDQGTVDNAVKKDIEAMSLNVDRLQGLMASVGDEIITEDEFQTLTGGMEFEEIDLGAQRKTETSFEDEGDTIVLDDDGQNFTSFNPPPVNSQPKQEMNSPLQPNSNAQRKPEIQNEPEVDIGHLKQSEGDKVQHKIGGFFELLSETGVETDYAELGDNIVGEFAGMTDSDEFGLQAQGKVMEWANKGNDALGQVAFALHQLSNQKGEVGDTFHLIEARFQTVPDWPKL